MSSNNLTIRGIIADGIQIGLKNALSLIGAFILWVLTIWIPYLNVGTTIGLYAIVIAMSKGGIISPTEIFRAQYRRFIGEFFLLQAFMIIGISCGMIFLFIPGMVIAIAWSQAIYLLIDRQCNPSQALAASNKITYGEKWTMFFGMLLLSIVFIAAGAVAMLLLNLGGVFMVIAVILCLVLTLCYVPVLLGAQAYIYQILSEKLDEAKYEIEVNDL